MSILAMHHESEAARYHRITPEDFPGLFLAAVLSVAKIVVTGSNPDHGMEVALWCTVGFLTAGLLSDVLRLRQRRQLCTS